MRDPVSKNDLVEQLRLVQQGVSATLQDLPAALFYQGTAEAWSACDYLKHLLLSNKPLAKALHLPPEQLERRFGSADRPSKSYAELVAIYHARLDEGVKAEDYSPMLPVSYKLPEGIEDQQSYLLESWNDTNNRLLEGIQKWDEAALDRCLLLHPAIGAITVREMLFFTLHHNTLHWHDMQSASQVVG